MSEYLPACAVSELAGPDQAIRREVAGHPVALVRTEDGEVYAVGDTCSHANVSLAEGEVDGRVIECWLHGSGFDLRTGKPTCLPAIEPVPVFPVKIDGDMLLVQVPVAVNEQES